MTTFRLLLLLIPAVFAFILAIPASAAPSSSSQRSGGRRLDCEVHDLKLKVAQLESILSESINNLSARSLYLDGRERLIAETSDKFQLLQSALVDIEDHSEADKRLRYLEEEVRQLWAELRKNNFDLHVLESRAKETDDALKVLTSRVKKLADIVSEQWIQIQHLEQALQITKMRTLEARRHVSSLRCTFLKFINSLYDNQLKAMLGMLHHFLPHEEASSSSYASLVVHHLKNIFSALRKHHHELQDCIQKLMERNEVTATLANKEFICFMASAMVVFPIMTAWLWLSTTLY